MYRKNDKYLVGLSNVRASSPAGFKPKKRMTMPFFFEFRFPLPAAGNKNFEAISKIVDSVIRFAGCQLSPLNRLKIEFYPDLI
jgi:hypothetical protein